MTTEIDELLQILYMVLEDLATALNDRYPTVNIDLRISATPAPLPGITPLSVPSTRSRFSAND